MTHGGPPKWKASSFSSIVENLRIEMKNPRRQWPKHDPNRVIRRGKRLANGDMLWLQDGKLYIEKSHNK